MNVRSDSVSTSISISLFTPRVSFRFLPRNPFSKSTLGCIADPFRDPSFKDLYTHVHTYHTCIYRVFHATLRFSIFDLIRDRDSSSWWLSFTAFLSALRKAIEAVEISAANESTGRVWVSRLKTKFSFSSGGEGANLLLHVPVSLLLYQFPANFYLNPVELRIET